MERVASQELSVIIDDEESYTPEKLNMEPKNGGLEDDFSFSNR